MADDARTQFIDGLRVSAEHLQHMQDRLREAVLDGRTSLGLGRVAWGLCATLSGDSVELSPGLAFAPSGVRLAVDAPRQVAVPADDGTFAAVLRAEHGDREPLRFNAVPIVLTLGTHAEVGDIAPAASEEEALLVATVTRAGGALTVAQDDTLFVATSAHRHTGAHVQESDGRWRFDGVAIAWPVSVDAGLMPWIALSVTRGQVAWALARSSGTAGDPVNEQQIRRGPPNGPWKSLPAPLQNAAGVLDARGRLRLVGHAPKIAPLTPLTLALAGQPANDLTPTAKGAAGALVLNPGLAIAQQPSLRLVSRAPGSLQLRDIDVTSSI